ncbi:MAG: DUF3168 domain-containing protein [Parvibaculaceae bacterium]
MTSPTLELTGAIVPALKASEPLGLLIGDRIFDKVPIDGKTGATTARFPYVSIGSSFEIADDADCIEAVEISFRIDIWSRKSGFPEALKIADMVRSLIHDQELPLPDNALVLIRHRRLDKLRDPDGLTSHVVLEFTAIVERG